MVTYDASAIWAVCLAAMLTIAPMTCAFGQTFYNMTVHNNFGTREFYNATPTDAQIWLLTNFKFSYLSSGDRIDGNATAGSYASIRLSDIDQGKIRLYRTSGGTRMYAVLSETQPAAAQLNPSTSQPYNYFE